jgi:hypothetical protein
MSLSQRSAGIGGGYSWISEVEWSIVKVAVPFCP